jgi:hypothetical protein
MELDDRTCLTTSFSFPQARIYETPLFIRDVLSLELHFLKTRSYQHLLCEISREHRRQSWTWVGLC